MKARNKKNGWSWRKIAAGATVTGVCGFLLVSVFFFPPSFLTVREVVVASPLRRISEMDLVRLSEVQRGDNLVRLRLSKVREKLRRYPWVRDVRLSKNIPGRLQLWVEEEEAVALIDVEGLYLVNKEGKIFKKVEPGDPRDFPVITGLKKEDVSAQLKPLVGLVRQFDSVDDLKTISISEIRWSRQKGISLFTKEPCVRVELGNIEWGEGLRRLGAVWLEVISSSAKPKVIDLSLKKRIVVKLSSLSGLFHTFANVCHCERSEAISRVYVGDRHASLAMTRTEYVIEFMDWSTKQLHQTI